MSRTLEDQVVALSKQIAHMYNQRKSTIVRKYGEEHSAEFGADGKATFYLPVDIDLEYASEFGFKFMLGAFGHQTPGSVDGEGYLVQITKGENTYATMADWLNAIPVNTGVDMDGCYGCQCWDYADAFWWSQVGRTLSNGGIENVYGAWTLARTQNAGDEFDLITDKTQIKAGDWIVWSAAVSAAGTGHIGMAAENYHGDTIAVYNQNNGGIPYTSYNENCPIANVGETTSALMSKANMSLGTFLGAFRYKAWQGTPPVVA